MSYLTATELMAQNAKYYKELTGDASMNNRMCVQIKGIGLIPVNGADEIDHFSTGQPEHIGDDAIISLRYRVAEYGNFLRKVRLLESEMMVKDEQYLVDLEHKEAWPFNSAKCTNG